MKQNLLVSVNSLLIVILLGILTLISFIDVTKTLQAQDEENPVLTQGNSNLGNIYPYSFNEILTNTGLETFQLNSKGENQRVGVIDLGFGGISQFISNSEIRVLFFPGQDAIQYDSSSIIHGTQVLEVIHTIVPEAEFYVCTYITLDDFVSCIDWFIVSQVKIINHSAGVPAFPLDGSSPWSLEVDRAAREGVLWVNAAGNFAGGYIQDFFTDNNLNNVHEFRGSGAIEHLSISAINQAQGRILLSWGDSLTQAANEIDLNLEVFDQTGNIIKQSNGKQNGQSGDLPLEIITIDMRQPFNVRIINPDNQASQVQLGLFVEFASVTMGERIGSIIAPADSRNALTVGALQGNTIAPYSSRGPVVSGALKPDITAPGEIILQNGQPFIGTSAAAPVVTGAAVLLWQANPEWTRNDIFNYLRIAVLDDAENPGPDPVYGMGRLYLPFQAPALTMSTIAPTAISETRSVSSTPTTTLSNCPNVLPSRLIEDAQGIVTDDTPDPINFRSEPNTSSDLLGQLPVRAVFDVLEGPECTQNHAWFRVRFGKMTGWIAEGDTQAYYTDVISNTQITLSNSEVICQHNVFHPSGLGCGLHSVNTVWSAFQPFENGIMFWRSQPDDFWVLFNDGSYLQFARFPVTRFSDNSQTQTPQNRYSPISGFGRIWGRSTEIQSKIGWGLSPEQGYDAQIQHSQAQINNITTELIYTTLPDGRTIEIHLNGNGGWRYL